MEKCCKNCKWHGAAIMVCFCESNEGIRVFNPTEQTCKYFEEYINNENEK